MFSCAASSVVRLFSAFSSIHHQLSGRKALRMAGAATMGVCLLAGVPLAAQSTNFGSVNVGSASASPTAVTLTLDTAGTVGSIAVLT